eukprot:6687503-Pyramimonas_sp.AAC.1
MHAVAHDGRAHCSKHVRCTRDVPAMLVPRCSSRLHGALSAPHDEGCRLGRPNVQPMPPPRKGLRHKRQ